MLFYARVFGISAMVAAAVSFSLVESGKTDAGPISPTGKHVDRLPTWPYRATGPAQSNVRLVAPDEKLSRKPALRPSV